MGRLEADPDYFLLSEEEKKTRFNGCGPKGWEKNQVLAKIAFHNDAFVESCRIHDFDFGEAKVTPSKAHLQEANERFLRNMLKEVSQASIWKRPFLWSKAYLYFGLCALFGKYFYRWDRD